MVSYKPQGEWEEQFQRWKSAKNKKEQLIVKEEKPALVEKKEDFSEKIVSPKKNKPKTIFFLILTLIVILIGYFAFKPNISNTYFSIIVFSLFILSLMFFAILFAHRVYEKSTKFIHPSFVLSFCYALIIANMLLSPKIYSLEWAFLGFLIITVIFYDFKIDSRFLILPALILLGYIPFLLIGAQKEIAETVAVYVYYFLVVGVVLQIVEHYKKTVNSIDFDKFIETFIRKEKTISLLSVWGVITTVIIIYNRFNSVELLKWSAVYIFVLILVFYAIAHFQEQKQYTPELEQK